jgi:hypothetical protein
MRQTLLAAAVLLSPAAALAQPAEAPVPQTAIREMIRRQLDSRATEPPPAPVPGLEAESLRVLPPLPQGTGSGARIGGVPGASGGPRTTP